MPYRTSLFIITAKTPFLSSLLIFLHHKSVNRASCTRTDIFIYRDCPINMPIELIDILIKIIWFSVAGFLFIEYF
jgi:hypothetical protein